MPQPEPAGDVESPLELEWIEDEGRWRALRDTWDDLVFASAVPGIFETWDFLETSWRVFSRPRGDRLAVLLVHEGNRPLAVVPLRLVIRRRFGMVTRKLKRLASWECDRVPFAFPKGREAECAHAVLRFLDASADRWDSLELREVPADGEFASALRGWARGRGDLLLQETETSPSPYVRLEGTWETFLSGVGYMTRKGFRRRLKHLRELASVELRTFSDPSDVVLGLDHYLEIEARSWKSSSGQGIGKNARNREFYRQLLPALAARGRGRVVLLEQSGRFLAGIVELRLGSTTYASHITFDREYARHSPGFVLQGLCLERSLQEGYRDYELFAKFLEDKLRWTKRLRPSVDVVVVRWHGLRRRILFAGSRLRPLFTRSEAVAELPSGESEP